MVGGGYSYGAVYDTVCHAVVKIIFPPTIKQHCLSLSLLWEQVVRNAHTLLVEEQNSLYLKFFFII